MDDLISVIVPVYNGEKFIEKCLNSIMNQEYKNLEILLVNDGSKDNSLEICEAFAAKDSRIKIFSKQNGGQASSRNFALDRMTGRYVTFVDDDDWIRPECCSTLLKIAHEHNADIASGTEFYDETQAPRGYETRVYTMNEYAEILIPDLVFNHVIGKLFKAELFNSGEKVRFPENFRSVEDMGVFPHVLKRTKLIAVSEATLYFYRNHTGNTTSATAKTIISPMERALIFIERYSMAADWVPDTMPLILKKAVWFGVSSYMYLNKENSEKYFDRFDTIRSFFVANKRDILESPLIDSFRKSAARLIISGWTWPFRILSTFRPCIKKIINKLYDRTEQ